MTPTLWVHKPVMVELVKSSFKSQFENMKYPEPVVIRASWRMKDLFNKNGYQDRHFNNLSLRRKNSIRKNYRAGRMAVDRAAEEIRVHEDERILKEILRG